MHRDVRRTRHPNDLSRLQIVLNQTLNPLSRELVVRFTDHRPVVHRSDAFSVLKPPIRSLMT